MSTNLLVGACVIITAFICYPICFILELLLSPISIPLYYIRKYNYSKWIKEWKDSLSKDEINVIEKHIHGPINFNEFIKFSSVSYINNIIRFNVVDNNVPKYLPVVFISKLNSPFLHSPTKEEFIDSLNYMLKRIYIIGIAKSAESRDGRIHQAIIHYDKECAICKEDDLTLHNSTMLECAHVFHNECISEAYQIKSECPLCRCEV